MQHKIFKTLLAGLVSSLSLSVTLSVTAHTNNHFGHRSDGHAPVGVMGDHFHNEGEWMITLRTMNMLCKIKN